ncbi:MAG: hypothetical protein II956_14010 [Bacteroidales bacterium]|nr:hypothetical protein [Bacteroidales bacterium]
MNVKTLTVKFNGEIKGYEIPLFRGAVIEAADHSLLFHNHQGDGYRYSYPLIQYKKIGQNPSIVCIEQGVESIGKLFENGDFTFRIGENVRKMEILSVNANKINVQLWETKFNFMIKRWLPLNPYNYKIYNSLSTQIEKVQLLEKILKGNILSFLKGLGIFLENELVCNITNISRVYVEKYKGVGMTAFDIAFSTNLSLPDKIGLGKNAALGFGVVRQNHLS